MTTDERIFNYKLPTNPYCGKCQCDELEVVDGGYYTTYKCKACGYSPEPEEED